MKRSRPLIAAIILTGAAGAQAAQYPVWGDTGWVYAIKRECCNVASAIGQDYSATACITPAACRDRPCAGGQRGFLHVRMDATR